MAEITLKIENLGRSTSLPCPVVPGTFMFSWKVEGVATSDWRSAWLELKSQNKVSGNYIYWSSGRTLTTASTMAVPAEDVAVFGEGTLLEVRLRLFDKKQKLLHSTHEAVSKQEKQQYPDKYNYPFEGETQCGFKWDSQDDRLYVLLDSEVEHLTGVASPVFSWNRPGDEDESQSLSYQLQWSLTPLFENGLMATTGKDSTTIVDVEEGSLSISTAIHSSSAVFYRVRAFDGLDYSPWSHVNGFYFSPELAPSCSFIDVVTNCTAENSNSTLRPNGEIIISFIVSDYDSANVSAYLSYKFKLNGQPCDADGRLLHGGIEIEYPCITRESLISVKANEIAQTSWLSSLQLPKTLYPKNTASGRLEVFLCLKANDGTNESSTVVWQEGLVINNTDTDTGGGAAIDMLSKIPVSGRTVSHDRWLHVPVEETIFQDGRNMLKEENPIFDWKGYWTDFYGSEVFSETSISHQTQLTQPIPGYEKKPVYRIYDGYDNEDGRNNAELLYLEDRDEVEARNEARRAAGEAEDKMEEFVPYFGDEMNKPILGRGIEAVQYFMPEAKFGHEMILRRPQIVHSRHSGLYLYGLSPLNDKNDYFKLEDEENDNSLLAIAVKKLQKGSNWKHFLKLDRMYNPEAKLNEKRVGLFDKHRYTQNIPESWTIFRYDLQIRFPIAIERDVNDAFSWRLNDGQDFWIWSDNSLNLVQGKMQGSLLDDDEDYMELNISGSRLPNRLNNVLNKLFPNNIFQEPEIILDGNVANVTIYSKRIEALKTFAFNDVIKSCYRLFGIDKNERQNYRQSANPSIRGGEQDYLVSRPLEGDTLEIQYEAEPDGNFPIDYENITDNQTEPLFTCDPIHVNKYGCHFKYSDERYAVSKKVYVRKYKVIQAYPFESEAPLRDCLEGETTVPTKKHRNYILKPAGLNELGEELFVKEYDGTIGGLMPVSTDIEVEFEGTILTEKGYWAPEDAGVFDPETCLSHKLSDDGLFFIRKKPSEIVEKTACIDIYVAEYVDLEEAWEHPALEGTNCSRISKGQAVKFSSDIVVGQGRYVFGPYVALPSQKENLSRMSEGYREELEASNGRASQVWGGFNSDETEISVEQNFIEIGGREKTVRKYGYAALKEVEPRFKISPAWEGRMIPEETSNVHDIHRDEGLSLRPKGSLLKQRLIISDVNKVDLPEKDGVKVDWADARVSGLIPLDKKEYVTGMPHDESDAYKSRKAPVYREARPLRFQGSIDSMSESLPWGFIYLQPEWNCYNMVHWEGTQDEATRAKIEVALVDEADVAGEYMTLKTKSSVWNERYNCWLIPFSKLGQYDCLDTLNTVFEKVEQNGERSAMKFIDGQKYRFRLTAVNVSQSVSGTASYSRDFIFSKTAYAPPVIVNVDYNKWTRIFTLTFRLDDFHSRTYDLIGFSYASYDIGAPSPVEADFIELGLDMLRGPLRNLESNSEGDGLLSNANVITHQVSFSMDDIDNDLGGKNVRFSLDAVPSELREGMDLPVFNVIMWPNEALKKAEDRENAIAGYTSRWKYVQKADGDQQPVFNDDGTPVMEWTYLPKEDAVIVPGIIKECENRLDAVRREFKTWYRERLKFGNDSIDARLTYIETRNWSSKLDELVFQDFLQTSLGDWKIVEEDVSLLNLWNELKNDNPDTSNTALKTVFLNENELVSDYDYFYFGNVCKHISNLEYWNEQTYEQWLDKRAVLQDEELLPRFIDIRDMKYEDYLESNELEDSLEVKLDFIESEDMLGDYEYYKSTANKYTFEWPEEALLFIQNNYSSEYAAWSPVFADGADASSFINSEDDRLKLFIASNRAVWEAMEADKNGTRDYFVGLNEEFAYNDFLQTNKDGCTYSQRVRAANEEMNKATIELVSVYDEETRLEREFRSRLIRKHYFCNGWKNNQPYVGNGKLNEIFRFRVENNAVTGSIASEYEKSGGQEDNTALPGYDPRWEVYFRFQIDFFDTFDSQNGNRPLLDYSFVKKDMPDETLEYERIAGGIAAEEGMSVLPGQDYEASGDIYSSKTNISPATRQYQGTFSIPRDQLPGCDGDRFPVEIGSFECSYFWRVCPYNLLQKPQMAGERFKLLSIVQENEHWTAIFNLQSVRQHFSERAYDGRNFVNLNDSFKIPEQYYGFYVWVAFERLAVPRWTHDFKVQWDEETGNQTLDTAEACYANFFHGTDGNRMDVSLNPENSVFQTRLSRGEVVFMTDRPRLVEDGSLKGITADVDQYKNLWLPAGHERYKPSVTYSESRREWLMVTHKKMRSSGNYVENTIVLSRGSSQFVFGEDMMIFPDNMRTSVSDYFKNLKNGAFSAENPFLLEYENHFILYFNLLCDNGVTEVWRTDSIDSCSWGNLQQIQLPESLKDPAVYVSDNLWTMYGIVVRNGIDVLVEYTSTNGLYFTYSRTMFTDFGLTRPTLAAGRLWFEMKSGQYGKIVSMALDGSNLKVELGLNCHDLLNDAVFDASDCRHSPFVFEDFNKGVQVTRIIFEMNGHPFAYVNGSCQEITSVFERQLYTMFLEEFSWEPVSVQNAITSEGLSCEPYGDMVFPAGETSFSFHAERQLLAVKVSLSAAEDYEELEAYGDWIDFYNVGKTDAVVYPGTLPADYDMASRTAVAFVTENDLEEEFTTWESNEHGTYADLEEKYQAFLLNIGKWGRYLKWQRKGPFTFNYSETLKRTSYPGAES